MENPLRHPLACYGYQVTPSGELSIDSAQASIVTFIFEHFAKGDSLGKISDVLARIDMILIKSASRFARNTVDALKIIRMLRRWKVDIYFEADDISTLNEGSNFILTLICARSQDESESKSADIKWGIQKSFANPDSKYYQRKCYGYKHNEKGQLVIDEKEAEVVRMIFRMANEGASLSQIAQMLQEQDIPSPREKAIWSRETLRAC